MKIALLADIHANAPALRAVLAEATRCGVERLAVAGDSVGYYFWPQETWQLLTAWPFDAVRGNHEDMLRASRHDPVLAERILARYGSGIAIAQSELDASRQQWLDELPVQCWVQWGRWRALLCHGTPDDTEEYVYPDSPDFTFERMAVAGADLVIYGHTHYPLCKTIGRCRVVNPGSVGQPRDRRPGAQWALFDSDSGALEHRLTPYDNAAVAREAERRHPDIPYLGQVLCR